MRARCLGVLIAVAAAVVLLVAAPRGRPYARDLQQWRSPDEDNATAAPREEYPNTPPLSAATANESGTSDVGVADPGPGGWTLHAVNPPLRAPRLSVDGAECPRGSGWVKGGGRSADGKRQRAALSKYSRYTAQYCNTTGMLQMHVPFPTFLHIVGVIARTMGIRRGAHLLDVGSGCGTLLNFLAATLRTTGLGVDMTPDAVMHAVGHARPGQLFCLGEALRVLRNVPAASFDHAIAFSVVHHIRRKALQCALAVEMLRVVRPGGWVLVGHLRGDKSRAFWVTKQRCRPPGAHFRVMSDFRTYGVKAFRRLKVPSVWLRKLLPGEQSIGSTLPDLNATSGAGDDP